MNNHSSQKKSDYRRNIFINCPFDKDYETLLKPMVFTILFLGYEPKIANESDNSGEVRITKIKELINESQYGIHDLSRIDYNKDNPLPRFNMPFELGLDFGSKYYCPLRHANKKYLILEKEKYRFKQFLSDLAGVDIRNHDERPEKLISELRSWFYANMFSANNESIISGSQIWFIYNEFLSDLQIKSESLGFTTEEIKNMHISEFKNFAKKWILSKQKQGKYRYINKRITRKSKRLL